MVYLLIIYVYKLIQLIECLYCLPLSCIADVSE